MRGKPHKDLQKGNPGGGNRKCEEPEAKRVPSTLGSAWSLCDWSRERHGQSYRTRGQRAEGRGWSSDPVGLVGHFKDSGFYF